MKILYEDSIPHGHDYFSQLGEARSYPMGTNPAEWLSDCDYLAIRSTTRVDETLLRQATQLKMIATATAGTNHMDTAAIEQHSIAWRDAGGCNAVAVAEYVVSVLLNARRQKQLDLDRITVGIVGAGHVGTALSRLLGALNISYVLNDPIRQQQGDKRHFVSLDEALECDVVTLHVPFTITGEYATANLIGADQLSRLTSSQLLINACRGEVIDETALKQRLQRADAPVVVLDVFNHEPDIDTELLPLIWLASAHTAGHSVEGKIRGTQMVYEQFCEHANVTRQLTLEDFLASPLPVDFTPQDPSMEALGWDELSELLLSIYDVAEDDRDFRNALAQGESFARIRKQYRVRRECNSYTLRLTGVVSEGILRQLTGLGFILETL